MTWWARAGNDNDRWRRRDKENVIRNAHFGELVDDGTRRGRPVFTQFHRNSSFAHTRECQRLKVFVDNLPYTLYNIWTRVLEIIHSKMRIISY